MTHHTLISDAAIGHGLPAPLDCETAALLRGFLTPLLETAESWDALAASLAAKGYLIGFRSGHMVLSRAETGEPVCTGRMLGVPLKDLSARLGRPAVRLHPGGHSADLC